MKKYLFVLFFALVFCYIPVNNLFAGSIDITETDAGENQITYFFDLRDRETFIQLTNISSDPAGRNVHIQIFNVDLECNENNFFDVYTPNDTHVYNMRDILTNDGNPSGVVLPENAYGIVVVSLVNSARNLVLSSRDLIGNFRVINESGYEYRTNAPGDSSASLDDSDFDVITFNFNQKGQVTFSDIVFWINDVTNEGVNSEPLDDEVRFEVDIVDLDENVFSCRNIASTCIDQDSPLQEIALERINNLSPNFSTNVLNFEYGINDAIPNSKNAPLICPGNNIGEGFVMLDVFGEPDSDDVFGFIGLNNGNGRGSMDSLWFPNDPLEDLE